MFSRIIHHLDMKDVGKKHLEKLAVTKIKEEKDKEEKLVIKEISKRYESNWRKELDEGLTTTNVFSVSLPAEGDQAIDQVNPTDAASFAAVTDMFHVGLNNALDGTQIRSSGSGAGDDGGFNVGGDYLAFQGTGSSSPRWALLSPMDSTNIDTITITAIRGNDSNGGEEPDVSNLEELSVIYKTPDMSISSYLSQDRNQNFAPGKSIFDAAIIPIGSGDGTLQNYSLTIPEYARAKGTIFGLIQRGHSGAGFDHYGVTDIKFQRRTPMNVVVPLDSPEAVSFIRVGTDEGDPKKRKKKVNDQLAASDEYVAQQMGGEFPGQGARIDGEDPFRSAPITSDEEIISSPQGKDEVQKAFGATQLKSALGKPESSKKADPLENVTDLIKNRDIESMLNDYVKKSQESSPLDKSDPRSGENYKENLPSWFTFSSRTPDGRIFGYNYSGKFGELKPASSRGKRGSTESGYGTKGYDIKTNTGGTLWTMDYDPKPVDTSTSSSTSKWQSRTEFMKNNPNSSMQDYLNHLPYGATNFMIPDPNFPGAKILDTAAYERYFMTGDTTGVSGKQKNPDLKSSSDLEPDFSNVPKTSEKILSSLDADIAKYSAQEQAAYREMKRIALDFGLDVVSLVGGLFTGGTSIAGSPSISKGLLQVAKKSGKGVFGELIRKILRKTQKKDVSKIDDIPKIPEVPNIPDTNIGPRPVPPKPKKNIPKDMEYNWNPTGGSDGRGQWEVRDIPIPPKPKPKPKPQTPPKPKEPKFTDPITGQPLKRVDPSTIKRPDGKPFDPLPRQTGYSLDPIVGGGNRGGNRGGRGKRKNKKRKPFKESILFERIKSKTFFNPKDIKPTFPKNPPAELDPETGMHPNYGKQAGRYKKLDPISANAMPPTGDPEIDAVVDKQRTKPKQKNGTTFSKFRKKI